MQTVAFRDFEERDIDFIFRCKNDVALNEMIVGQWHPFSYDEAIKWVHGCMGEHETYRFWAICTNNEEKRIVGWLSLSEIDKTNSSACFHSIVIADKYYNDGFAWIEAHLFIMDYVFEHLHLNRLYGMHILNHKISSKGRYLFLWTEEGILRQASYKNNIYYDLVINSILKREYDINKKSGEYELRAILKRMKLFK